jgi:hypothetical protein
MKSALRFIIIALTLALAACQSSPQLIVGTGTDATGKATEAPPLPIRNATVVTDLQSAAYNLDNAIAVGALPANDPAAACVHGVLQEAGIEVPAGGTAPKSFVPKNDGVVSLGAIAYIQVRQRQAAGAITVPMECKTVIGQFVIDGMGLVNKVAGRLLLKLP